MRLLSVGVLVLCLVASVYGFNDASNLLGSWSDSSHTGEVGDAHFCGTGSSFHGTYGKTSFVSGTLSADGKTATGTVFRAGVLAQGSNGLSRNLGVFAITAEPADSVDVTYFEGAEAFSTSDAIDLSNERVRLNWIETRLRSGAQEPTSSQCLTSDSTAGDFTGNWFGGAAPPLERDIQSDNWSLCKGTDEEANVVFGSYGPGGQSGYIEGVQTGNVFQGEFWEIDPCGPDRQGSLLLVSVSETEIRGFKWLGTAGTGEYLGDVTLRRQTPDNSETGQLRLCEAGDIRDQFSSKDEGCNTDNVQNSSSPMVVSGLVAFFLSFVFMLF